ncbi:cytochrome c [Marinoscillum sp. 108]|uniref:cytochrome c n=1 Tax=Marinoscillum sp. 108 TaxID=2653151 RepID=UPI0012F1280D|nr:cytochrome c [Marinoscillum sp. 108]VXD21385.1 Cytochrome C [Marinoscillum sp. 108]
MKILKILGIIIAGVILLALCGIAFIKTTLPDVGPAPEVSIAVTPELVARGAYLANSVTVCMDCHSTREWSKFSGPLKPNTLGQGGEIFNQDFGFPGSFTSKNITPAGVGDWTDGELYRLITTGVTKDGNPIFPVMPYKRYGQMADEDIYSIIAYIRSLAPIQNEVTPSEADFPMSIILHTIPQPGNPQPKPDKSDVLAYGAYMANAAACGDCHTPQDKGAPIMALNYAGSFEFNMPGFGIVRSANITPDEKTGIGSWSEDFFVNRFKAYADSSYVPHTVGENDMQTVMPWLMYATMEEEDLRAIYTYLRSLPAIENKVVKFTPASER